jgi:hypothetical protein
MAGAARSAGRRAARGLPPGLAIGLHRPCDPDGPVRRHERAEARHPHAGNTRSIAPNREPLWPLAAGEHRSERLCPRRGPGTRRRSNPHAHLHHSPNRFRGQSLRKESSQAGGGPRAPRCCFLPWMENNRIGGWSRVEKDSMGLQGAGGSSAPSGPGLLSGAAVRVHRPAHAAEPPWRLSGSAARVH